MATFASLPVQMASVMEVLSKTAIAVMTKLVDDASLALRLEISRSREENEALMRKLLVMEGELRAARGCGEGTSHSSLNVALEVDVCDEFKEEQNSKFTGKGRVVGVERVFDERFGTDPVGDEQYVVVEKKEAAPDVLEMKCEPADRDQDWSESVLFSEDFLEVDTKTSQSQIIEETSYGPLGAVTTAGNGGEGPLCCKEELQMQPCTAGDPEKGLQPKLKQEPDWVGEPFDHTRPLLKSEDLELELPPGMVLVEHGLRGGSARVKESFDASVKAESTPGDAAAKSGEGPLCEKEGEEHMQPCPAGVTEKGLQAELEQEGEPLNSGHLLPGSAGGLEVQCAWSKSTISGKDWEMLRQHGGSSEHGGERSNDRFPPCNSRTSRRLRSEKNKGPTLHLEQQNNGHPHRVLEKHQRIHRRKKPFPCSGCDKTFSSGQVLQAHQCVHTGEKPHICRDCGKCLRFKSNLKKHQCVHTREKLFVCTQCEKSFSHIGSLKTHQITHARKKSFCCTVCNKSFPCTQALTRHQRVHTGEKPFICDECGKSFTQLCHLKAHRRVHTGERPYRCDECGKSFTRVFHLKSHKRVHTGEKPYSCDECGKSFTQLANLKYHQTIHTGVKPYSCDECGKSFAQLANLKCHQTIHTGVKPYSCDECGKSFGKKARLMIHQRVHIGEKPAVHLGL